MPPPAGPNTNARPERVTRAAAPRSSHRKRCSPRALAVPISRAILRPASVLVSFSTSPSLRCPTSLRLVLPRTSHLCGEGQEDTGFRAYRALGPGGWGPAQWEVPTGLEGQIAWHFRQALHDGVLEPWGAGSRRRSLGAGGRWRLGATQFELFGPKTIEDL